MTSRLASSCEPIGYNKKLLHAEIRAISALQRCRPSKRLCNVDPALSDPPGLHEAELGWKCRGSCRAAGIAGGLQGYVQLYL